MAEVDLTELRKQCMASLYLCTENAAKYLQQNKESEIKKLQELTQVYCELDEKDKVMNEALDNTKREIDLTNIHLIQEKYEKHLERLSRNSKKSEHQYLIDFKKCLAKFQLRTNANLDESDLALTESVETFIDPITKKPISDPVRNKKCGHIYEKSTIIQLLTKNHRLKCPVAGCGNRTPVSRNDLEEDEELTMRMAFTQQSNATVNEQSILDLDCSLK